MAYKNGDVVSAESINKAIDDSLFAVTTANDAKSMAGSAVNIAGSAGNIANSAKETATTAETNSRNAVITANDANTKSNTAIATSNTASSVANSAKEISNETRMLVDSKIDKINIIDDLKSIDKTKVLSANMGRILNEKIEAQTDRLIYGVRWIEKEGTTVKEQDTSPGERFITYPNGVTKYDLDTNLVAKMPTLFADGSILRPRNDFDNIRPWSTRKRVLDSKGNVIVQTEPFYFKKGYEIIGGVSYWVKAISMVQYPGFDLARGFIEAQGNVISNNYTSAYEASNDGTGTAQSKSGFIPWTSIQRNTATISIQKISPYYHGLDLQSYDIFLMLFEIETATRNSQSIFAGVTNLPYDGNYTATVAESNTNRIIIATSQANNFVKGCVLCIGTSLGGGQIISNDAPRTITSIETYDANNSSLNFDGLPVNITIGNIAYSRGWGTGATDGLGEVPSGGYINNTNYKYPFRYRFQENPYGNVYKFIMGANIRDYKTYVCEDYTKYADIYTPPYFPVGYTNSNTNGYATQMGYDSKYPYANITTNIGGSSSTYYSDYYYQSTGDRLVLVGGVWFYGARAGARFWSCVNDFSVSGVNVGLAFSSNTLS